MVFQPEAVPNDHYGFLEWCAGQTKWSEGHSYKDPSVTPARLRAWFLDVIRLFPPLNEFFPKRSFQRMKPLLRTTASARR